MSVGDVNRRELLAGALDEVSEVANVIFEVLGVDQNRLGRPRSPRSRSFARGCPWGSPEPQRRECSASDRRKQLRGRAERRSTIPSRYWRTYGLRSPRSTSKYCGAVSHRTSRQYTLYCDDKPTVGTNVFCWNRTDAPGRGTRAPGRPAVSRGIAHWRASTGEPPVGPPSGSPTQ